MGGLDARLFCDSWVSVRRATWVDMGRLARRIGIYAETEAKEHVSGSGFWLLVAGTGSATKETEDIKSYCLWEQKDNKGFQMEAYKADDDSFYFYRIDDDSSPRIEKWTIRHKNNFGFYKSRTEYRVYLNDEVMQDSWQF